MQKMCRILVTPEIRDIQILFSMLRDIISLLTKGLKPELYVSTNAVFFVLHRVVRGTVAKSSFFFWKPVTRSST